MALTPHVWLPGLTIAKCIRRISQTQYISYTDTMTLASL